MNKDFQKYAGSKGINSLTMNDYTSVMNKYLSPNIVEERELNIAVMSVFDRLMADRIIFLGTPIDDTVSNIIQAQLLYLDSIDSQKDIQIYINSPGGSVFAGLGIYDTMQYINPDIKTICTGLAASMGAVLLCGGSKDKRLALPHSRIMIHQPLGGVEGQASDIIIQAQQISILKDELYQIIAKHTNKSIEIIEKDGDRDFWMTADEAKEYGMIDKVIR